MLAATLLLMLNATPDVRPSFLVENPSRRMRLVSDEAAPRNYETMSRVELKAEYERLESLKPSVALGVILIVTGASGGIATAAGLGVGLSSFFGIAVYAAVFLTVGIVVSVGLIVIGGLLIGRLMPARQAITKQMEEIETVYREGRCRNVPGQRPCLEDPNPTVPPPPGLQPPGAFPQVMAPTTIPFTLAVF